MRRANRDTMPEGRMAIDLSKVNEKRQWYKPDGTPLPVLLPVDDYNRKVFLARGWTLRPPAVGAPAPVASKGLSPIEQEIQQARAKALAKAQAQGSGPITREVEREIAGKVRDKVPVPALAGVPTFDFLSETPHLSGAPEPVADAGLPGDDPDAGMDEMSGVVDEEPLVAAHFMLRDGFCACGWRTNARLKGSRKQMLNRHLKEKG